MITLNLKLRSPTINSWANKLCTQWDHWIANEGQGIDIRFKLGDGEVKMGLCRVIRVGDGWLNTLTFLCWIFRLSNIRTEP